jgi:hypothetical protein
MPTASFRSSIVKGLLSLTLAVCAFGDEWYNVFAGQNGVQNKTFPQFIQLNAWDTTVGSDGTHWAGYEYEPSVVIFNEPDGTTDFRAYYCGSSGKPAQPDVIYMTKIGTQQNSIASSPTMVINNGETPYDHAYVCAPSLVYVSAPPVQGENYALYYECANSNAINQVCVAFSADGITFHKWPVPVILSHATIPLPNGNSKYGSGHPSAVVPDNGSGLLYLFYYGQNDGSPCIPETSPANPGCVGMWLQGFLMDGLTPYGQPIYTRVESAMQVKYYRGPGAPTNGMFVGVANYAGRTYLNYSIDGVHWDWNDASTHDDPFWNEDNGLENGLAEGSLHYAGWSRRNYVPSALAGDGPGNTTLCVAPGTPTLASDQFGRINTSDGSVQIFEGEGQLGGVFSDLTGWSGDIALVAAFHADCANIGAGTIRMPSGPENTVLRGFTWNLYEIEGQLSWTKVDALFSSTGEIVILTNMDITSGTGIYQTPNTITAGAVPSGSSEALTAGPFSVSGSASITFTGNPIKLEPGFHATAGSAPVTFHAVAGP